MRNEFSTFFYHNVISMQLKAIKSLKDIEAKSCINQGFLFWEVIAAF